MSKDYQKVRPFADPGEEWSYAAASGGIVDTGDVVIKAAVTGKRNYLSSLQFLNTHATVGTELVVKDGATIIWRGYAQHSVAAVSQPGMVPVVFASPLKSSSGVALNVACITTGTQTYVNAQGYTAD